ncbi:MAG TPA: FMN-binding negative transcriptional regulator, partial [Puia sp.]|nr:FMN-binding negative transcriptional regulator [Puia sp.]
MYDIPYFKAEHPEDVLAYMKAHPFAFICGADSNRKPVATQIPILFEHRDEKLFLQGHFMKKQDHTNAFMKHPEALVIFSGAHTYVSASWYENKHTASTWNYQSVQASGVMRFMDTEFLLSVITRLTEKFEAPGSPSLVQKMDPAYVQQMMHAIVAFELEVLSVRHVFKLSQNRDDKSRKNIVSRLSEQGADALEIARAMEGKHK